MALTKNDRRQRIRNRIRKIVSGKTISAASSRDKDIVASKANKSEAAALVGKSVAEKAMKAGVTTISFDRGGYLYHGRIKSLAEGAREAGLKF